MSTGCTSCVALLTPDTIYCANSGDSRCVLARGATAVELSEDHKPDNVGEKKRIEAAGGFVEEGRVNGSLSLSRALGDMEYKMNKKMPVDKQAITCVPELQAEKIHPNDDFLIIACDGIWDCKTSQQCVDYFRKVIGDRKANEPRQKSIEKLFDDIVCDNPNTSTDGSGTDNMTCILVEFNKTSQ
jgi:serine/threonine protein phosphatase PrpC